MLVSVCRSKLSKDANPIKEDTAPQLAALHRAVPVSRPQGNEIHKRLHGDDVMSVITVVMNSQKPSDLRMSQKSMTS